MPENSAYSDISLPNETSNAFGSDWGIFSKTTENTVSCVYPLKSSSLVTSILFSLRDNDATYASDEPFWESFTSKPWETKKRESSIRTFSSSKNFRLGVDDDITLFRQGRSIIQSSLNMLFGKGGEGFENFFLSLPHSQKVQNLPDHNAGTFEGRLAMADRRISDNVFVNRYFVHALIIAQRVKKEKPNICLYYLRMVKSSQTESK